MENTLKRPCTQEEFNAAYQFQRVKSSRALFRPLRRCCSGFDVLKAVISCFPALKWIPDYNFRTKLILDLQAGFTVAVLHIPQGMGYAALGGVNPIVGIYMAIFPIFVYVFMGTSRHISLGSFSIICLMAGKPVSTFSSSAEDVAQTPGGTILSPIEVASVVCLTVGMVQAVLGLCRVGTLSIFMSESLVSGFTTGAAVLVVISQLEHIFGVKLQRQFGVFNAIYTVRELVIVISKTNYLALAISLSVIVVLTLYTDFVNPKIKCKFVLPMELIVMIVGTLISYLFDFSSQYSINTVGTIPTGIPSQNIPPFQLIPDVLIDSILIAVVSFSVHISMASMFAMKDNYKIDPSQELIAAGCGNILGGFFSCLPMGVSLSRSVIQYSVGGKTQFASIFSALLLLTVVLYLGKYLEPLPYSVLAGIVTKSLKGILMQVKDLPKILRYSIYDGVVWLITFFSVVILNMEIGLGIALVLSLLSIILLNQNVYVCLLGRVPDTDLYLEMQRYRAAEHISNFIIIRIHGGLHFANIHFARIKIEKLIRECLPAENIVKNVTLVLDMSTVTFVDPDAMHGLINFIRDLEIESFNVLLTCLTGRVYEQMKHCDFFINFPEKEVFPSIDDAVFAQTLKNASTESIEIKSTNL